MTQAPLDLGQRMIQAARLAVELHLQLAAAEIGRQPSNGLVTDGQPFAEHGSPSMAVGRRSPWTWAGENPAGSF
jgi:hypothetical protein